MKHLLLTLAAAACISQVQAQIVETSTPKPLLKGVEREMYYPILSEDGTRLLFSNVDFSGLRMYDYNDNVTVTISEEARAGFDAVFTPDGRAVYFVAQQNVDGLNMRQVKQYNVATGNVVAVTPQGRMVARPAATNSNVATMVDGKIESRLNNKDVSVRIDGSTLFITRNGVEKAYSPVESYAGYLWASVSPDKTKVLFFAAGKGAFVIDLQGNVIAELGNYESPVWYGNDLVVAMNADDNGYQYCSSQIIIMRADGSEMQELTRPESMAMNPTASFSAGKIVYNTIDGRLYEMNVTIK